MKIPMLVLLVGILSGIATGLLVASGLGHFAAGFLVIVIAGVLAFLYWRVRLALAKMLSNTRSIQNSLEQLGDFEKRLRKLQSSVSNLETIADASTSRIRRDITHESGKLKSELLRINTGVKASVDELRGDVSVTSGTIESQITQQNAFVESQIAQQNALIESTTMRIRRDLTHESGILKTELLRINAGIKASVEQLSDDVSVGSAAIQSRIAQLNELADVSTRRVRNDLKMQGRETNALIERNHGARLKESDQNSRLLNALDKQRDLLGTLVINSDFQFKNVADETSIGQSN